jgi:hypothetical protein
MNMAIEASTRSFIHGMQRKVFYCHQATFSIYSNARYKTNRILNMNEAYDYATILNENKDIGGPDSARKHIPPSLYDVFGFFFPNSYKVFHSAIVVDDTPKVMLAECDNRQCFVRIHSLEEVLLRFKEYYKEYDVSWYSKESINIGINLIWASR